MDRAREILTANKQVLSKLADELFEKETVSGERLETLLSSRKKTKTKT